jgi:hypothetical protein
MKFIDSKMIDVKRIKIPGIHFQDQNNEQYSNSNQTIVERETMQTNNSDDN